MSGAASKLEGTLAQGLRWLPDCRGKAYVGLHWKGVRERRGPPDGEWRLPLSDGSVIHPPRGSAMTWSVAATGYWDPHLIEFCARYLEPETIALDIGAPLGLWTLPLARAARARGGRLRCFEPNPANLPWPQANIERNGLVGVADLHPVALGGRRGTARLGYRERGGGNGALLDPDVSDGVEVQIVRLDDLDFPQRVCFLRMDVEGFEVEVLRGARALISRDRPSIFGEFNTAWLQERGEDLGVELAWVAALGYEVFEVEQRRSAIWRPKELVGLRRLEPPFTRTCENLLPLPALGGSRATTATT